jgi:AcrR family transcriptional regulator
MKGFAGASIEDLATESGMKRPSLYHAFGDKRTMYLTAYRQASGIMTEALSAALKLEPITVAMRQFYQNALSIYVPEKGAPTGCFAVGTALAEAPAESAIRDELQQSILTGDAALTERFKLAGGNGQLCGNVRPEQLAMVANAALHGLAVRARAGLERGELERYISSVMDVLFPEVGNNS